MCIRDRYREAIEISRHCIRCINRLEGPQFIIGSRSSELGNQDLDDLGANVGPQNCLVGCLYFLNIVELQVVTVTEANETSGSKFMNRRPQSDSPASSTSADTGRENLRGLFIE